MVRVSKINCVSIYVSDAANLCFVAKDSFCSRETAKESEKTVKLIIGISGLQIGVFLFFLNISLFSQTKHTLWALK